jgi:hypothetical protein
MLVVVTLHAAFDIDIPTFENQVLLIFVLATNLARCMPCAAMSRRRERTSWHSS